MRSMRVLVVTQYFWPESFRINELINALHQTGCEITVLTGQPNYPDGKIFDGYTTFGSKLEKYNGYDIVRVPLLPRGKSGALRLLANYCSFVFFGILTGRRLLKGRSFDIIFAVNQSPILAVIPAIYFKKKWKIPLVTWIGDLWPQSLVSTGYLRNQFLLNRVEGLVKWIYKNNDALLVQSATFSQPVKTLCGSVPVDYLPNPGENIFSEIKPSLPALLLKKGFNIVYAGNIGTVQALDMIVAAAELLRQYQDIRFVLVGSGSRSEWLQKEAEKRGLSNIELPGRFQPGEVPGILEQADALLVSLVKDPTMSLTVPAKTQTYMAAGKPVIAALDGEGARVITEAGAGIAVPAEDADELAKAVLKLTSLPGEERAAMGLRGRKYFEEHYESASVAQKLNDYLAACISAVKPL